ncbi:MAG TPA: TonB-dependent hemoglobin/transferrin/lactoferrin family receptor, partial [Steroidobacteraceae bacterium]|nr:TonB-dependent hemoglobin/transferrin/lactoferrin family receptor [Steroidobacteraceae bacterium]
QTSGDAAEARDDNTQTMRKVSVAATRGPEELANIPVTVTVKDAAEIEFEIARDIKDLVRYEPGVSVSNASTRFGLAGFNIRGIEGNRIATLIDGVRVSDGFAIGSFSEARRNLVDLDMLKTVEIVRGPASALYGSDAIGGVVSFRTKDPIDFLNDGEPAHMRVRSTYRSDNEAWTVGWISAFGDEQLGAVLSYRRGDGEETENRGHNYPSQGYRTDPNPQDRSADSLLGKVTLSPNEQHTIRLTIAFDRDQNETDVLSSQGRGAGAFANIFTVSLKGDDKQQRARVGLEHSMLRDTVLFDELEWRIYGQESKTEQDSLETRYTFSTGPSSTVIRDREFLFEQDLQGGEILARKSFSLGSTEHLLTYGIDLLRTETAQLRNGAQTTVSTGAVTSNISPDNFPVRDFPNSETRQYALYIQEQASFANGKVLVTPGARVDYYKLTPQVDSIFAADNPGVVTSDLTETSVSPKLGALWHFTDQYSLYGNYSHGFRAPPYNDVNIGFTNLAFGYTAIANPDLRAETSDGLEVGVRGVFEESYFSLATYYTDYTDFIESTSFIGVQGGLQVFQSRNLVDAHIYGAEFRAGAALFDGVRIRSSIAYSRGSGRNESQVRNEAINSVNPLKGVLGVTYQPNNLFSVEIIGTGVAGQDHYFATPGTTQFSPGGYFTLDLLAQMELEHVRFNVGVFNLTDKFYWEWSDVRGVSATSATMDRSTRPGLNFGASVAVNF